MKNIFFYIVVIFLNFSPFVFANLMSCTTHFCDQTQLIQQINFYVNVFTHSNVQGDIFLHTVLEFYIILYILYYISWPHLFLSFDKTLQNCMKNILYNILFGYT